MQDELMVAQNRTNETLTAVICRVCGDKVGEKDQIVKCDKCQTPHHRECWKYNGKCSVFGCGNLTFISNQEEKIGVSEPCTHCQRPIVKTEEECADCSKGHCHKRHHTKINEDRIQETSRNKFRLSSVFRKIVPWIPLAIFLLGFVIPENYQPILLWLIAASMIFIPIYLIKTDPKD